MPLTIGSNLGKYLLSDEKGSGNFGTVYQALDRATDAVCALKCIPVAAAANVEAVLVEARALRACACQHIVRVNTADVFNVAGDIYVSIEMEYLPDGSVEKRMADAGLSIDEALTATRHMLLGLSAAHDAGILHRDVKPGNIMIDGPDFKLSDFGIAHIKAIAITAPEVYTFHGAPEVLNGEQGDERSDIYAAGMTLFRLSTLNGEHGVTSHQFDDWVQSGMGVGLPEYVGLPEHLPRKLKNIILKATASSPADRFQSAAEMLAAVERLRAALPWRKTTESRWEANQGRASYEVEVRRNSSQWVLEYKINNRRKSAKCSTHNSEATARKALNKLIASELLA